MELAEAIKIRRVNGVTLRKGPRPARVGSLVLVGHHLIFSPNNDTQNASNDDEFWLLHRAVDRVVCEPIGRDNPPKSGSLTLKCKNFMLVVFEVPNYEECQLAAETIEVLSNITECVHDYPFFYRCPFQILDNGWNAFDVEQEYARLTLLAGDSYRISSVNENFQVCPTYPEKVIVPKGIGDDYLRISATFRDGGRFPVISYFHKETKSCILRCGQPLVGPTNRRCKEDETILNSLLTVNKGIIIDTRSKQIAQSAKNKGGGHETPQCYSQWRYICCATPRLREMRDSLTKMVDLFNDRGISSDRFISRLSSAGWLQAVADCLNSAANVAQCVHCEGTPEVPVVIHGGEGVDTTLIVVSMAQIILDPDARTIRGFQSLIEREWIMGGHPFALRNAHCAYAEGSITGPQEGPVFLCFLDCMYQIMSQYPHSFEFGEELLIFLFEHAYASEFGTFLGNCERDKQRLNAKNLTVSLWSYLNNPEILRSFVNVIYEPREAVIWPAVAPQSIRLWDRLFLRWQKDWTEEDSIKKSAQLWRAKEKELTTKALVLRKQLIELSKEASLLNGMKKIDVAE